jgi:hypothetical protein
MSKLDQHSRAAQSEQVRDVMRRAEQLERAEQLKAVDTPADPPADDDSDDEDDEENPKKQKKEPRKADDDSDDDSARGHKAKASEIIAAGNRRRGESDGGFISLNVPQPPKAVVVDAAGLAKQVIAAGKKRRAEA